MKASICAFAMVLSLCATGVRSANNTSSNKLPQPFEMLNVTGKTAGTYHCPVCEYGTRPYVLVFLRDPNQTGDAVLSFLKQVDGLASKYPDARFGASAIFLGDGSYRKTLLNADDEKGTDLIKALAAEKAIADKARDLAASRRLQTVHVGLAGDDKDSSSALAAYRIPAGTEMAVFVFYKMQEVGRPTFFGKAPSKQELDKLFKAVRQTVQTADKENRAAD